MKATHKLYSKDGKEWLIKKLDNDKYMYFASWAKFPSWSPSYGFDELSTTDGFKLVELERFKGN